MGILGDGYHPSAASVIASSTDQSRRGSALGLHMLGGSVAHFVAPLAAAAIATSLGWRSSFLVLSIPSVVFGIVFYVFYVVLRRRGLAGEHKGSHRWQHC
jgi:ACS family glucarate transporter-like MFS transporter